MFTLYLFTCQLCFFHVCLFSSSSFLLRVLQCPHLIYWLFSFLGKEDFRRISFDFGTIPEKKKSAAKVLFETIANVLGNGISSKLSLDSNFYEIGGNSLNSVFTVTKLRDQGYVIGKYTRCVCSSYTNTQRVGGGQRERERE